jgi:hypothetical protein
MDGGASRFWQPFLKEMGRVRPFAGKARMLRLQYPGPINIISCFMSWWLVLTEKKQHQI